MRIERLDHLVLTVQSIEKTCDFYSKVLGMEIITFGEGRKALRVGNQKINLHQKGNEYEPKALNPAAGSGDLCFITKTGLNEVINRLECCNIVIEEGPVERTGTLRALTSVYIRDPDGNLIELSNSN